MPLVNAKCTNCGAPLTVDSSQEAAVCKYCGSAYIVEKAIQNYYVTNQINADNVFVTGKGAAEKERLLKNAETYESYKDYGKAWQVYSQVTEEYPDEYRGWLGLALLMTNNFEKVDFNASDFDTLSGYMSRALMSAPPEKDASIRSQWDTYLKKRFVFIDGKKRDVRALESKKDDLDKQIQEIYRRNGVSSKKEFEHKYWNSGNEGQVAGAIFMILWSICMIAGLLFSFLFIVGAVSFILGILIILRKNKKQDHLRGEKNTIEYMYEEMNNINAEIRGIKGTYNI